MRCEKCNFRVRGKNHKNGDHHENRNWKNRKVKVRKGGGKNKEDIYG